MLEGKRCGAVLLMAGEGRRFGGEIPKQFRLLREKPVYLHALNSLKDSELFEEIILVCHPLWVKTISYPNVVAGGKTRQESSYIGLLSFKLKPDLVLIHDAARPFISPSLLKENLHKAHQFGAANTCIPSTDTVVHSACGETIDSIPQRNSFFRGQTPQTFRYDWILQAHEKALKDGVANASDDCQLILNFGKKIYMVSGNEKNLKITSEIDLKLAEALFV